ncbi:MAG: hypothetical protein J1E58_01875 [Prevotella sp.]|nr:hypothetical protein [Prevotella sp.]
MAKSILPDRPDALNLQLSVSDNAALGEMVDRLITFDTELLDALYQENESYHFNHDRTHNAIAMRVIFETSSNIKMYCGEMSIFRNGFYSHISKDNNHDLSEAIKKVVIEAFHKFITKVETTIEIIFETYDESYLEDVIFGDSFKDALKSGKIKLYSIRDYFSYKENINHFCCGSNFVRYEEDKKEHRAICAINDVGFMEETCKSFALLKNIVNPITLTNG